MQSPPTPVTTAAMQTGENATWQACMYRTVLGCATGWHAVVQFVKPLVAVITGRAWHATQHRHVRPQAHCTPAPDDQQARDPPDPFLGPAYRKGGSRRPAVRASGLPAQGGGCSTPGRRPGVLSVWTPS
jgi:hypothetical protein